MTENPKTNLMAKVVRYAAVLMGVCLVSATCVSVLYVSARERIKENELRSFQEKLDLVFGEAHDPAPLGEYPEGTDVRDKVYIAKTESLVRYAAMGSAQGYQSKISVLVAVDAAEGRARVSGDPTIFRLAVVSSSETPGLGENIGKVEADVSLWGALLGRSGGKVSQYKRAAFQEQFSGKRLSDLVVETKADTEKIFPITGATITSKAVVTATRRAIERIMQSSAELYDGQRTEAWSELHQR